MQRILPLPADAPFTWVDLVDPSEAETRQTAADYGLPAEVVRDFLKQPHLPKCERVSGGLLVILRAFDEEAPGGDTYQALTRRLVVFLTPERVFTVRRREQPFAAAVAQRYRGPDLPPPSAEELLSRLASGALKSFEGPLKAAEEQLDRLETLLLGRSRVPENLHPIYAVKRRCSVIKRILQRSFLMFKEVRTHLQDPGGWWADLQEEADRLQAWCEELLDAAVHLLNLQLGLQSQRTNEVMRLLTLFSAFFLPLTFLAGLYGMNFKRMPELEHPLGYPLTLGGMALLSTGVFLWFRHKGWLK